MDAVREVGNPTILATFTVIAALLPMGFVSGMMGPYMEPIPALGSVAMLISLFAAFVFTPYLAISDWLRPSMRYLEVAEKRRISADATVGLYWFGSTELFLKAYDLQEPAGANAGGELYVAPLYNLLLDEPGGVWMSRIPAAAVHPMGTPDELEQFEGSRA